MDEVIGQKMLPPIVLSSFLSDFKAAITDTPIPTTVKSIQKAMNLLSDNDHFQTVANNCSIKQLYHENDARVAKYLPGCPDVFRNTTQSKSEVCKLKLFKSLHKLKATAHRNPFKRTQESFKTLTLPAVADDGEELSHYNDLLITVRIYRPARATHVGRSLEKPVFAEEFVCLGTNLLTELRDKISCVCNKWRFFDISNDPTAPLPTKETDPGYFFITDTFYNDMRNAKNADYSEVIRNWATNAPGLKDLQFKVGKMEETRFIDLTVSLGFPQLYQHHGNCEHVFVFSQVELVTPAIAPWGLKKHQYPRLRSINIYNNRLCHMCGALHYVYIVLHSDRQLHDPAYLCAKCFHSYHYVNGKKIGEFNAYNVNSIWENHGCDDEEATTSAAAALEADEQSLELSQSSEATNVTSDALEKSDVSS